MEKLFSNRRRSWALVAGFVCLFVLVVAGLSMLGGLSAPLGLVIALVLVAAVGFLAYWKADAVTLRVSRARPAPFEEYTRYHNLVEGLCVASGLSKPRLYVVDDPAPNAFATGRNPRQAAVVVTSGLLERMNRVELEGVLAHELSHIKNGDVLVSTLAVTMVGAVAVLADLGIRAAWWGMGRSTYRDLDESRGRRGGASGLLALPGFALLVFTPLVAQVMRLTVGGPARETLADMSAVEMTRYPPGLIAALEKLQEESTVVASTSRATAHLWIGEPSALTPAAGRLSRLNRMFVNRPPLEERIALLQELS